MNNLMLLMWCVIGVVIGYFFEDSQGMFLSWITGLLFSIRSLILELPAPPN